MKRPLFRNEVAAAFWANVAAIVVFATGMLYCAILSPAHAQVMTIGETGGNHTVRAIYVGESGGNHTVLVGWIGTASGNKRFFAALSATATPGTITTTQSSNPVTGGPSVCAASGGVGPYSYAWTISGTTMHITSPSSASTTFTETLASGNSDAQTATCTVTDSGTGATAKATVSVTLIHS